MTTSIFFNPMKRYFQLLALLFVLSCSEGHLPKQELPVERPVSGLHTGREEYKEMNEKAWHIYEQAMTSEDERKPDEAIGYYRQALYFFRQLNIDTMIVKTMGNIGVCYWDLQQYDKAIEVLHEQLDQIDSIGYVEFLPICYNNLGLAYYSSDDYPNAIKYYGLAIHEFRELNKSDQLATSLLNQGILLKNRGIYEEALKLLFEAEQYLWKGGNSKVLASCYEAIGLVNHHLKDYHEAIDYHQQALVIRKALDYKKGIANSFNNIGLEFMEINILDSALIYFKKSIKIKEELGNPRSLISTIENLGRAHQRLGNSAVAEQYYLQGIRLSREEEAPKELATLYHLSAQLKTQNGQFSDARHFLDEAEKQIEKIKSRSLQVENLKLKKELYTASGQYFEALKYADRYLAAKDSLLSSEKSNYIAQLQVLHQVEKKEQENHLLKQQALLEKFKFYFTLAFAIALLVLFAGSLYVVRVKSKLATREKLWRKEMDHRTKNNLQLLSAFFTLQAQYLEDEVAIEAVKRSEGRVNAMAIIHQKLYQHTEKKYVDMHEFIMELIDYLKKSYGFYKHKIQIDLHIEHLQMDVDQAIPMGLIINEVITNAFKYAFGENPHPALSMVFHQKGKKMELIIRDNGPGMSEKDIEKSFGHQMIHLLCRQLKGNCKFASDQGTRFELVV